MLLKFNEVGEMPNEMFFTSNLVNNSGCALGS